ncbi:thioredoxin domain-containing protein [Candidatus Dojkabacteria bacterium]|nr:thioredoxin domain-containing protein [Candidatus Dojkabacteria bacterium]
MAKTTKKVSKPEAVSAPVKKENVMVLDMDKLLIPFSILIAGLMIALAIIFTLKGTSINNDGKDTGTDTNTGSDTGNDTGTTGDGTAKITIDDDPYLGDKKKAKVAIVEFSDYECPFCQRHFTETHADLVKNYVDTGKAILVFRDFPLSFHDPKATNAALAAQCVFEQKGNEAYFKFHDLYFTNTVANGEGVPGGDATMESYAKQAGADVSKYKSCYSSKKFADEIKADITDGSAAGVTGTPGFIIGKLDSKGNVTEGTLLAGAYPYADFQNVLDKLLK